MVSAPSLRHAQHPTRKDGNLQAHLLSLRGHHPAPLLQDSGTSNSSLCHGHPYADRGSVYSVAAVLLGESEGATETGVGYSSPYQWMLLHLLPALLCFLHIRRVLAVEGGLQYCGAFL